MDFRGRMAPLLSRQRKAQVQRVTLWSPSIPQPSLIRDFSLCQNTRTLMVRVIMVNMLLEVEAPAPSHILVMERSVSVTMTMIMMFGVPSSGVSYYLSMTGLTIQHRLTQQLLPTGPRIPGMSHRLPGWLVVKTI